MSEETAGILEGAVPPARNPHLYGHQAAEEFLARSYRSGKGHHAILIEGPEGIGKATLAFRFANHVLSHPDPATAPDHIADPDLNSSVSRQIASGASHNLLHLARPVDEKTGKTKTAITVDEVRRAGHFFSQTSGTGNWRIVIIDPADDLNRNAANAILKILEEPPRRALFLVLSHAPGKLLPTIRSRCQSLRLSPLGDRDLAKALAGLGTPLDGGKTQEMVLAKSKGSVFPGAETPELRRHRDHLRLRGGRRGRRSDGPQGDASAGGCAVRQGQRSDLRLFPGAPERSPDRQGAQRGPCRRSSDGRPAG
jgi:DNA polymerase-3 subunit delta'